MLSVEALTEGNPNDWVFPARACAAISLGVKADTCPEHEEIMPREKYVLMVGFPFWREENLFPSPNVVYVDSLEEGMHALINAHTHIPNCPPECGEGFILTDAWHAVITSSLLLPTSQELAVKPNQEHEPLGFEIIVRAKSLHPRALLYMAHSGKDLPNWLRRLAAEMNVPLVTDFQGLDQMITAIQEGEVWSPEEMVAREA